MTDESDVKSVEEQLPDAETLKEISEALYSDVKAEYVDVLDDEAHDTVHAAIHYIGVFYQLVEQRDEDSGLRGPEEIERRREKANIRINNLYKNDSKIEREDIIEETLDWVLGVRDSL